MGVRSTLFILPVLIAPHASAVLFYSTGDPTYNTTPPSGALTNSGWQYEGVWVNSFLGTPIGPHHFITAHHIQASVGDSLVFNGQTYQTIALYDDPETDLRIGQVCGTFPYFAPLYTTNTEVGRPLVVFGKGTQRDSAVYQDSTLKGWMWGIPDGLERWGENQVAAITNAGPGYGEWLQMHFTSTGNSNHATLSTGDSGGGVFIQEGATWKLAGINISVDSPYNTNTVGSGFNAAIFDERELYIGGSGAWSVVTNTAEALPSSWYSTRISSRITWINGILTQPPPAVAPVLQTASVVTGPYVDDTSHQPNTTTQTFTLPVPTQPEFFRLRSCIDTTITSITISGGNLVIHYQ